MPPYPRGTFVNQWKSNRAPLQMGAALDLLFDGLDLNGLGSKNPRDQKLAWSFRW
jgi:hypothetical protein